MINKGQSKSEKLSEIRAIEEKLETLCSRVDNLENMRYKSDNTELQVVTTEQPSDLVTSQEQQV